MSSLSRKNTPTERINLRFSRKHVAQGYSHGPKHSVRLGVYRQTIRLAMDAFSIELLICDLMFLDIDGMILLLFLPHNSQFPIDGIRFQEPEAKFTLPAGPRVSGGLLLLFTSFMLNNSGF